MDEHPNAGLVRKGLEAFGSGDMETVQELIADDVVWHSPGNNPLSGDYGGKEEVFGLFARLFETTGGNWRFDVHDVVANDEHAVALVTFTGGRPDGRATEGRSAQIYHLRDGKLTEFWAFNEDQAAVDSFFS